MTGRTTGRLTLAAALALASALSCKVQLTPESIKKTYDAIKDARKDLTPENEYYVGRSVATNLLARNDYRYLDGDALRAGTLEGVTAYVNRVGQVVVASATETTRKGDRPGPISGWHFVIIEDDTINGFAAPGGWVFVTRGAVTAAENEDQLAALLAHEVAHVVRGHALGSIKKSRWAGVTKTALDASVELDRATLGSLVDTFDGAMDDMIDATLVKGYSRKTEYAADRVGLQILAHAGYDPNALVDYIGAMSAKQETGSGGYYSTHPKANDRLKKLAKEVAKYQRRAIPGARTARFLDATAPLRSDGLALATERHARPH